MSQVSAKNAPHFVFDVTKHDTEKCAVRVTITFTGTQLDDMATGDLELADFNELAEVWAFLDKREG